MLVDDIACDFFPVKDLIITIICQWSVFSNFSLYCVGLVLWWNPTPVGKKWWWILSSSPSISEVWKCRCRKRKAPAETILNVIFAKGNGCCLAQKGGGRGKPMGTCRKGNYSSLMQTTVFHLFIGQCQWENYYRYYGKMMSKDSRFELIYSKECTLSSFKGAVIFLHPCGSDKVL